MINFAVKHNNRFTNKYNVSSKITSGVYFIF